MEAFDHRNCAACFQSRGQGMSGKRVKLADLIEAGIIETPFSIHVNFKNRSFSAEVDSDGFVLMDGKRHTSLSIAGGVVRAIVSGTPNDGLAYRRVNGWIFWRYTDENGQVRPMDVLRKKYNAGKPLALVRI